MLVSIYRIDKLPMHLSDFKALVLMGQLCPLANRHFISDSLHGMFNQCKLNLQRVVCMYLKKKKMDVFSDVVMNISVKRCF